MADLALIPESSIAKLAEDLPVDDEVIPLEKIRIHITTHPNRIPQLFALIIHEMPYFSVLRHFQCLDQKVLFCRFGRHLMEVLGATRTFMGFVSLLMLEVGEKDVFSSIPVLPADTDLSVMPVPDPQKLAALDVEMAKTLVTLDTIGKRDLAEALATAEKRAVSAEKKLKDNQLSWIKREKRMQGDAERAKKNLLEKTQGEKDKVTQAIINDFEAKLSTEVQAREAAQVSLALLTARIKEIEEHGGATPERVEEIRIEIQREADLRIEDQLSIAVRPWLVKLLEIERARTVLEGTQALCSRALAKAKQEVEAKDILVCWEQERNRALKILEKEMTELDDLMRRVMKPTPELSKMHSELLEAMLTCRKQLNPDKPLGEVAKALISGLKKVKDEDLGEAAYAFKKLADKGVFLGLEAETLLRIVEGEKQARYDLIHFKKSVQGRMIQRLHAGGQVDILIDGYNYMFTAIQYFGDKLKLNRNAAGEAVFGESGRAKLNSLLLPMVEKFPNLDLHIFYDGLIKENRCPHPRISLWEPTYQREGKGQADAEIAHVGLKRIRQGAMAVVVTNDKEVQRYADHFLSVRLFSDFIATA